MLLGRILGKRFVRRPRAFVEKSNYGNNKTVGVVGAGQMGHGIAHVMLRAGHRVLLLDTTEKFVDPGTGEYPDSA